MRGVVVERRRWMSMGKVLALVLGGGIWVGQGGCSGGGEAVSSLPVVRDSAGITIVENRDRQWGSSAAWCVGNPLTTIGAVDGPPPYQLFTVLDATRLSDGTVVVGNSSSGELRFFGPDGTFIRSVGSADGGPGEFKGANALRAVRRIGGDSIFTWDLFAQTASVFASDGTFAYAYRLDGPARMLFYRGMLADGSLLMMAYDYESDESGDRVEEGYTRQRLDYLLYGSDHRLLETLTGVPGEVHFQAQLGTHGMITVGAPFARVSSVATDASLIYLATGEADEIAVHHRLAEPVKLIRRVGTTKPLTAAMIERDRQARMAGDSAIQAEEGISPRARRLFSRIPYPEVVPPYGRILVDSEANLWAQVFRVRDEDDQAWSVFDPGGVWLGEVTLPRNLRVYEIGADYVLGRLTDDLGVERVLVFELRRGGCAT